MCEEHGPGRPTEPGAVYPPHRRDVGDGFAHTPTAAPETPFPALSQDRVRTPELMNFYFQEEEEEVALPVIPNRPKETR